MYIERFVLMKKTPIVVTHEIFCDMAQPYNEPK